MASSTGTTLVLPMLAPIGARRGPGRGSASFTAAASAPGLLKPIRLISALSAGSRNSRGCGLPGWARPVMVPISA